MGAPLEGLDKADLEARRRAARIIHEKFKRVFQDIMRGKPPKLVIPKRTLSNIVFDPDKGILLLGEDVIEREFLDVGESRKFMQTLLMASIIYQSLVENEYPTIRDLYYKGKHTIIYRDLNGRLREENTWDEQKESDEVIQDVEVFTGLLREEMLILSKEKGKVVGNMKIRSGGDVIDLSKLGHGAYAIESTPDLIEFVDVDADFVLVVEKDAVFQQLHRIGFWRKYRALLVTGSGQPDRATRRFVRRLNEELNLPVYVITDSIPEDEVVVARDLRDGRVHIAPIGSLLSSLFTPGAEREWVAAPLEVPSWNPASGRIEWSPVAYAYRHRVRGELVEIITSSRGSIRVTGSHSLFVDRGAGVEVVPARLVRPGHRIVVANRIPAIGCIRARNGGLSVHSGVEGSKADLLEGIISCARAERDYSLVRVERVRTESYDGYVYDLAVPGNNSFVGGHGVVYHNSDPYGWYIYSVYKVGSINLSYESERLATPKAKFLGVSMTDVFGYRGKKPYLSEKERRNFIIKATDKDLKRAKELMKYSWLKTGKWRRELSIFLSKKAKLEIEAMASKGLKFFAFKYIPEKIETGDWID